MSGDEEKRAAASLSVWSNSFLVTLKVVAGLMMGSVGVISEAMHSGIDLVAAVMAKYSVKRSAEPADRDHQFGHGKFENMSGLLEGALIFVVAAVIVIEASRRLLSQSGIDYVPAGMAVMAVSALVNIYVSRRLFDVAKRTDSLALEADAYHLRTDVWTSAGVFVALGIIQLTGWNYVDPVVALIVAAFIVRAAYSICRRSADGLLDRTLPEHEMRIVREVLIEYETHFVDWHRLRARKTGSERQLDLHVTVPSAMSVSDSHALVEAMEREIHVRLPRSTVIIHVEPCEKDCAACRMSEETSEECR